LLETDKQSWESKLVEFVEEVMQGKQLSMNSFYSEATIVAENPDEYFVALKNSILPNMSYEESFITNDIIYLGDVWSVLLLIGETLGILKYKNRNDIFVLTRADMETYAQPGDPSLLDALMKAKEKYQTVLLSNATDQVAKSYLNILGFQNAFSFIAGHAGKPGKLFEALEIYYPGISKRPETILTIGDHAYNDLMPVKKAGGKTVWINPFVNINEPLYDVKLETISDLADYINQLCD